MYDDFGLADNKNPFTEFEIIPNDTKLRSHRYKVEADYPLGKSYDVIIQNFSFF